MGLTGLVLLVPTVALAYKTLRVELGTLVILQVYPEVLPVVLNGTAYMGLVVAVPAARLLGPVLPVVTSEALVGVVSLWVPVLLEGQQAPV